MRLPDDVQGLGCCEVSCLNCHCLVKNLDSKLGRLSSFVYFFLRGIGQLVLLKQYTMSRGVVHACHAGGVVHLLEGWTHNEVGAIDVDRIDLVWEAALKHGLKPVASGKA